MRIEGEDRFLWVAARFESWRQIEEREANRAGDDAILDAMMAIPVDRLRALRPSELSAYGLFAADAVVP